MKFGGYLPLRSDTPDEIIDFDPGILRCLRQKVMDDMRKEAVEWLERERDKAYAHIKRAEQKSGVAEEEIRNLSRKIRCIDYALLCVTLS